MVWCGAGRDGYSSPTAPPWPSGSGYMRALVLAPVAMHPGVVVGWLVGNGRPWHESAAVSPSLSAGPGPPLLLLPQPSTSTRNGHGWNGMARRRLLSLRWEWMDGCGWMGMDGRWRPKRGKRASVWTRSLSASSSDGWADEAPTGPPAYGAHAQLQQASPPRREALISSQIRCHGRLFPLLL